MNDEKSKTRTATLPTAKILLWNRKLAVRARVVENFGEPLNQLVDYLTGTMYEHRGVGLAAPQIGCFLRVAVIQLIEERTRPPLVLVNPVIVNSASEITEWEGCLSLPGDRTRSRVKRPRIVKVVFQDINGVSRQLECSDMLARAVQHEVDHLDGKFFIDRIQSMARKVIVAQYQRQVKSKNQQDLLRVFMLGCPFENDTPVPAEPLPKDWEFNPAHTVSQALGITPVKTNIPVELADAALTVSVRVAEAELSDSNIQLQLRRTALKSDGVRARQI